MRIAVAPGLSIESRELEVSYLAATGPGGQNVNKVATAAQLRFDAAGSPSLPDALKARLPALAGRRMTQGGVVVITARRFRTQERNREDAVQRLLALLRAAAERPTVRRPTRPSMGERRRRLEDKAHRGARKRDRARPPE